ncbi:MAG: cell division protein FtsW [Acidobacteria bacterium 13_1_40CM_2_68_10]|nr:MAG: cell division protein FtsW [Acidobacteria bacterium 13_1_40CM_2_68_10]OLE64782.1 MAG: cell division protein FtsW [Acidobacteria bacterium 13_1_20CM_2_68_14]
MARKLAFDKTLFGVGIGLTLFGLVMIYSASAVIALERFGNAHLFLVKQAIAAALGIGGMIVAMHVDYRRLLKRPVVYFGILASTVLLIVALASDRAHQVHRWIVLGPVQIQPSEIGKLALILFLAYLMARKEARVNDVVGTIIPCAVVVGQLALLVYLQPDLGTAAIYVLLAIVLLFLAGLRWRYLVFSGGACALAIGLLILQAPYRVRRILSFMNPDDDPLGAGFQVRQSILAVASGGLHGQGVGESRQKLFFLPEPHTDFVFSVISEELGLIGAAAVIVAFGVLFWRGVVAAAGAPDRGGYYLGMGITIWLVVQAMLNMAVTLGLMPTKGIPLPFLSYGGSSLVVSLCALGVLLNISQHSS